MAQKRVFNNLYSLNVTVPQTAKVSFVISLESEDEVVVESLDAFTYHIEDDKAEIVSESDLTIILPKDDCPEVNIGNVSIITNFP